MKNILFVGILFFAMNSFADILYFDANNSPAEILTAEKAATVRGERLIVFPPRTPAQQQILNQYDEIEKQKLRVSAPSLDAYRRMDAARTARAQEAAKPAPNAARLKQLDAIVNEQAAKMYQSTTAQNQLLAGLSAKQINLHNSVSFGTAPARLEDLDRLIASYNVPGKSITSIIFSGHHDFHSYTGVLGSLEKDQVAKIFAKYPEAKSSVKSVYGWGCYSGTVAEKDWWIKTFPSVQVVGGFDAGSPGKDRPASLGYLRDSLVREKELIRLATDQRTAHDVNRIKRLVESYNGFTMTNAAICTRGVYVGRNTGSFDLAKANNLCSQQVLTELINGTNKFNNLLNGVGDIPCNGGSSWLRTFYNQVRTHQHCGADLGPLQPQFARYTHFADRVIRLIDTEAVMQHFRAYYVNDLRTLAANQNRCGFQIPNLNAEVKCEAPPMQNPNTPKITHLQLMQFTQQLWGSQCSRARPVTAQNAEVSKMNNIFVQIVRRQACIPLSWVTDFEPGKPIEAPVCRSQ